MQASFYWFDRIVGSHPFYKLVYRVKSFVTDLLYQNGSKKLCNVIVSQKSYTQFRVNLLTWH